jgi:hypothetical protein
VYLVGSIGQAVAIFWEDLWPAISGIDVEQRTAGIGECCATGNMYARATCAFYSNSLTLTEDPSVDLDQLNIDTLSKDLLCVLYVPLCSESLFDCRCWTDGVSLTHQRRNMWIRPDKGIFERLFRHPGVQGLG